MRSFVVVAMLAAGLVTGRDAKDSMRAVLYQKTGGPDNLEMQSVPMPEIANNQVLVEVHSAAVNPIDYEILEGNFYLFNSFFTHRPGFDVSGTVVAIGKDCKKLKVDDEVYGMTSFYKTGTLAEFLAIDESFLGLKPPTLSHTQAAALPVVSLTSHEALLSVGHIKQGSSVLVLGGSTATGMMGLQLAKTLGAKRVVTTASAQNAELVKSLGADEVVDYHKDDVFQVMKQRGVTFDIIYETVGGGPEAWKEATSGVLARGGQYVTITGDKNAVWDLPNLMQRAYQQVARNLWGWLHLGGAGYHFYLQEHGSTELLEKIRDFVETGAVKPVIDKTFAFQLDEVKEAFSYLMKGHAKGKVVVEVKSPNSTHVLV